MMDIFLPQPFPSGNAEAFNHQVSSPSVSSPSVSSYIFQNLSRKSSYMDKTLSDWLLLLLYLIGPKGYQCYLYFCYTYIRKVIKCLQPRIPYHLWDDKPNTGSGAFKPKCYEIVYSKGSTISASVLVLIQLTSITSVDQS